MKMSMPFFLITLLLITGSGFTASAQDMATAEKTFKQTCAACHSIGKGRLVGPDLANINDRRPEDWIVNFVKSSQTVIKSGDKYADSLFTAYNKTLMPDHANLNDGQIKDLIAYIDTKSTAPSASTAAPGETVNQTTVKPADKLFTTTNYILFGAMLVMLIVILSLARINKNLLDQIEDFYSSDRSFSK